MHDGHTVDAVVHAAILVVHCEDTKANHLMPTAAQPLTPQQPRCDHRATAAKRGYDARWQAARLAYLRTHPLCVHCQRDDRTEPASVVDHIIPHRGVAALF